MQPVVHWPAEAIWQAVVPYLPGFTVEVLPEIDSSNSELMRRCRAGQSDPTLLVAERQTAGRELVLSDGRRGRASGVSASGALRLDVLGRVEEVISGEVSVRPVR